MVLVTPSAEPVIEMLCARPGKRLPVCVSVSVSVATSPGVMVVGSKRRMRPGRAGLWVSVTAAVNAPSGDTCRA